jgi:cytochrome c biogenesis protein ResB
MDQKVALFVVIMTAMVLVAALLHSWMRTRGEAKVAAGGLDATRQVELLSSENAGLKGQMGRLEERIAVLERIATDPSERTAREIDQMR